ncbi:MAG TPA: hypothetical protein VGR25_07935 [bacterium]|jgi:hypothetical protein|nr:hypothetical protein [bacterium]
MVERLTRILISVGWVLGAAVILYGIWRFWQERTLAALLISLAVVIAGPLEDALKAWVRRVRHLGGEAPAVGLVDAATSVVFLILLLWTISLLP